MRSLCNKSTRPSDRQPGLRLPLRQSSPRSHHAHPRADRTRTPTRAPACIRPMNSPTSMPGVPVIRPPSNYRQRPASAVTREVPLSTPADAPPRRGQAADLCGMFCSEMVSRAKEYSRRSAPITCIGKWCCTEPRTIVLCRPEVHRGRRHLLRRASSRWPARRGIAPSLPVPVGAPLRESSPGGVYGTPPPAQPSWPGAFPCDVRHTVILAGAVRVGPSRPSGHTGRRGLQVG